MALFDQNFGNALQTASPLLLAMAGSMGQGQSPFANAAPALLLMRKQRAEAEEKRRKQEQQAYYNALIDEAAGSGTGSSARSSVRNTGTAALPRDMGSDTKPGFFGNTVKIGGDEFDMGRSDAWAGLEPVQAGIFKGESGGDYDALFGFSNRSGKQFANAKLTDMTVNQALDFANPSGPYGQWVKGQIGRVATPMGAYQVVGTTLRAARDGMGLTGNERMTPELQDRIGKWIYDNQGVGAWHGYAGPADPGQFRRASQPSAIRVASRGDTRTDASIAGLMGGIQAEPQGVQMAQASQFGKAIPDHQQSPFVMPQLQKSRPAQQQTQRHIITEREILKLLNAPDEYVHPAAKRMLEKRYNEQNETPDLKSVTLPDGRTVSGFIGKNGEFRPVQLAPGVVLPKAPPEQTSAIKEFEYSQSNPEFNEWQRANKAAGATNVNVNPPTIRLPDGTVIGNEIPPGQNPQTTNTPRDSEKMSQKLSEGDVAYLDAERDRARAAEDLESMAERLLILGPRAGYTGPGGGLVGWLDDAAEAMGGDLTRGDSGARKAFKAESTNVQLGFADKTKGAISDKEMALFASAATGLATTPEGNKLLAEILRAGSRRVQSRYDFMEKYAARRGSLQGAESAWDAYIGENPMLVEDSAGNLVVNPEGNYQEYLDRPQTIDITPGKIMQMNEKELNDFRGSVGLSSMTDAQRAAYRAQLERLAQ